MSSIKVALELDDSKYTQRLKEATTAADKFAKAATTGATQTQASFARVAGAADNLQSALGKVGSGAEAAARSASTLVSALTGLAAVAFIQSLLSGASASKDMSEAFGLSVESVLELQAAFGAAGRGPEKLNQALATLSDTAVGALQGNFALRDSFAKLGISMSDLQTKSAKEIIQQVADVMTSGRATAAQLAASYDILGKSAKGLPWGDLKDKLDAVNGTMGPAADAATALDRTMKNLEATGSAVKKEFTLLLKPIADFFNEITVNGNGAKTMAQGIAGAIALIGGAAVINGLRAVAGSVGGLISLFTGLTAATVAAGAATTVSIGLSGADAAARTIQAVGLGRVGTALVAVNVAQSALTTMQASGIATATALAAAEDRLAAATARLAVVSEAATAAQATLSAAQGGGIVTTTALGTAAATSGGLLVRMGAAFSAIIAPLAAMGAAILAVIGIVGAPVWATVALAIAAITAAVTVSTVIWKTFGDEISAFTDKILKHLVSAFESVDSGLTRAANSLREFFGMKPSKDAETALKSQAAAALQLARDSETSAQRLARLGVAPNESGGRAPMLALQAARPGSSSSSGGDRPLAAGVDVARPMLAQEQSLRDQLSLIKLQNELQSKKLALQLELVGASDAEKASRMAALEFESKKQQDLLRITGEIAKMQATMSSGVKGEDAGKYGGQLALLQQQKKLILEQKDDSSVITGQIITQGNALKDVIFYREMELKAANSIRDINSAIADLNASEDQRRINSLEKQIALEIQAAQKRAQDQKGDKAAPMGQEEALVIAEKVRESYAGQLAAQQALNTATRERNEYLFVQDLTTTAITEAIRLQAEMAKLTQSSDQQKITDLNTQLELLIRQQIVKESSGLGRGETLSDERQLAIREEVLKKNKALLDSNQLLIDKSREWSTGWSKAFTDYKSDAFNAALESKTYFETFTSGMENAFVNFVQTGKLSFKDLANSMIADFARIAAKKATSSIITSLFGGFFADGGSPPMGKVSVVGENGPELFVPNQPGTIIPNGQFGSGGDSGSSVQHITYNIQATDAASFKAQLARDPSFLHAVVEQGRRSTPSGARR